ncbi:FkbM family methyltransferase [Afipia broomeae]|uniref:FkbM family methyltransferase n=1 Tax=Afipia broomeae ATCC 49717 TaxID=883078 RepID=K8PIV3_9BRAD|nr:FkbM family methyltransferase [Afipia broomeae]EKS38273.1 FkbM family methyltransferase [Afipia broomeae ATCC 49717]
MPEPMISYAQNAEDVILNRAFSRQRTGFYIDVGAWDPDFDSVTKHFYLNGWRGINIEPTDLYHARLMERRPADINLKVAVGPTGGRAQFLQHGDSGLSGLVDTTERLASFNAISDFDTKQIEVEVMPLSEITSRYAAPTVDFLKIDVEGGERGVIESAEWRAFRPRVVIVESIKPLTNEPSWFDWEGLLFDAGYCFALFDGLNRYYYRAEEPALRLDLSTPANVLDAYVTASFKSLQDRIHELESRLVRS